MSSLRKGVRMIASVFAAALVWLAAGPDAASPEPPPPPASTAALEPVFAEIVDKARALKTEVEGLKANAAAPASALRPRVEALAALDLQGRERLIARNADGDLKCILRGIAEDLPVKLGEVEAAKDAKARNAALDEMIYLLNDNVEVVVAPPKPPV